MKTSFEPKLIGKGPTNPNKKNRGKWNYGALNFRSIVFCLKPIYDK